MKAPPFIVVVKILHLDVRQQPVLLSVFRQQVLGSFACARVGDFAPPMNDGDTPARDAQNGGVGQHRVAFDGGR